MSVAPPGSEELEEENELEDLELLELLEDDDEYFAGMAPKVSSPALTDDFFAETPTTDTDAPLPSSGLVGEWTRSDFMWNET